MTEVPPKENTTIPTTVGWVVDVGVVGDDIQQEQQIQHNQPMYEAYFSQLNKSDRIIEALNKSGCPLDNKSLALIVSGADAANEVRTISELRNRLEKTGRVIRAAGGKQPTYTISDSEKAICDARYLNWMSLRAQRDSQANPSGPLSGGGDAEHQITALRLAFADRTLVNENTEVSFTDLQLHVPAFAISVIEDFETACRILAAVGLRLDTGTLQAVLGLRRDYTSISAHDAGKLVLLEVEVVSREAATEFVVSTKFECPACGSIIPVLQTEDKLKEPSRCACGRRGQFRTLTNEYETGFDFLVEEMPRNLTTAVQEAAQFRVALRGEYYSTEIDTCIGAGQQLLVIAYVSHTPTYVRGSRGTKLERLMRAIFVRPLREDEIRITINEEDLIAFRAFASLESDIRLKQTANIVFPSIAGQDLAKRLLAIQMYSGTGKDNSGRNDKCHILFVGGIGSAKSSLADASVAVWPKNTKISVATSKAAIAGAAYSDPLTGRTKLGRGVLAKYNRGAVHIEEINLILPDALDALLEPLESATSTLAKGTQQRSDEADTIVIATCNPQTELSWGKYSTIDKAIGLRSSLISRFDFVLPIVEDYSVEVNLEITRKIAGQGSRAKVETALSYDQFRRYVLYVRTKFPVTKMVIEDRAIQRLADVFLALKSHAQGLNVTRRDQVSVRNLAYAFARSAMRQNVTVDDIEKAYALKVAERVAWQPFTEDDS